jgi:NAD(P)-dependent dehydrogenase (short-subunit alcohol dehydrogenase family)
VNMQTEFDMTGKIAFVSGASSGFGAFFSHILSECGCKVVMGARRIDRLYQLVEEIKSKGGCATAVALDVTDSKSVQNAFDFAENLYGTVNVVSNNAGVADTKSAYKIDEAGWDRVIDTNLKGVWLVAMEAGKRMMAAGVSGSIVNSGSILGIRVALFNSSYCASKAGVIHLTKSLALEWAHKNIRVNALCPGYFPTEMTSGYFDTAEGQEYIKTMPSRRIGRLEELRAPFLLLASDAGSYINGAALPVDGAHSLGNMY